METNSKTRERTWNKHAKEGTRKGKLLVRSENATGKYFQNSGFGVLGCLGVEGLGFRDASLGVQHVGFRS